ncbi:MAG: ferredoxin--NADP(+) reductase [Pirellulaceae bacterium]|nr:MAG: ferredoxin--NADP(+) reductase [Pirellulaceae bacterium]
MKWISGVVRNKIVWAEGLFTLQVEAPEVEPFEAGQFLQLGVEQPDGHLHRPYSVASPHGEILDFFIVLVETGKLTPILWKLAPGDAVDVSTRAAGSFTLSHCPDGNSLWLLCTGTGLAPYIAMLRTATPWQRYPRIVLVHGVRYQRDLAYREEISRYQQAHPDQLAYVPVVSREAVSGALSGRITTCLANGTLEAAAGSPLDAHSCVMMCGNPAMLDETERLLQARGLKRHRTKEPGQIVVERYW